MHLKKRLHITSKAVISNPLILGCLAGIIYSQFGIPFPVFIDNSLALISMVALPLALISVGGSLSFKGVNENLRLSLVGATLKLLVLPAIGWGTFKCFGVYGVPLQAGMILLSLPASTAIYVLSSQMHSDTNLASATIVISTLLSFIPLSVVLLL